MIGGRRTGKNAVATALQQYIPNLTQAAFADDLKWDVELALGAALTAGIDYPDAIHTALADRNVMGPLWQWWGTELVRRHNPSYWIKRFDRTWRSEPRLIITDVRFQNEADYILINDGCIIRVVGKQRIPKEDHRSDQHPSETEAFNIQEDFTFINSSETLAELETKVYTQLFPQISEFFDL